MAKALSIVGPSGSGKTELICRLLAWFERRGLRVAVLKHTHHRDPGDRGKDTWRFRQAGAALVALSAPGLLQVCRPFAAEPPLAEVLASLSPEVDLILVEGYKFGPLPKILVLPPDLKESLSDYSQVIAQVHQAPMVSAELAFQPEVESIGALILTHLGMGN